MGRPKCWLPFGGERLLARVVRRVAEAEAVAVVLVVAAPGQEIPETPGAWAVVRDSVADQGPLRGLATGLRALPDAIDLAFAVATDQAMVEPAWVDRLAGWIGDQDLAIPRIGGHFQPLLAIYRRSAVLPVIDRLLLDDQFRLGALVESTRARIVTEAEFRAIDPALASLDNLNTPEAFQAALKRAGLDPQDWDRPVSTVVELSGVARLRAGTDRLEVTARTLGEATAALAELCPPMVGDVILGDRLGPRFRWILEGRQVVVDPQIPLMAGERLGLIDAD